MKTKFLKIGMPIMVFMLAIVFAFASEKNTTESEILTTPGYIFQNGMCTLAPRTCSDTPGPVCQVGGLIVHKVNNGTFCSIPMTNWN